MTEYKDMIAVTDRHVFDDAPHPTDAFLEQIARLASLPAPPKAIVLREKDLSEAEYGRLAALVQAVLAQSAHRRESTADERFARAWSVNGTCIQGDAGRKDDTARAVSALAVEPPLLVVHGFPETAEKLGIPRVHLPLHQLSALRVQEPERLRPFTCIGTSVHSVEDARLAERCGASYCFVGNIFETTCKPGLDGRGLAFLADVVRAVDIPVYAIGGICAEQMPAVRETGAAGGCMMSGFMRLK